MNKFEFKIILPSINSGIPMFLTKVNLIKNL